LHSTVVIYFLIFFKKKEKQLRIFYSLYKDKAESVIFARIQKMRHSIMLHGDETRDKSSQFFNMTFLALCRSRDTTSRRITVNKQGFWGVQF